MTDKVRIAEDQFLWKLQQVAETLKTLNDIKAYHYVPQFEEAFDVLTMELSFKAENLRKLWENCKEVRRYNRAKTIGDLKID